MSAQKKENAATTKAVTVEQLQSLQQENAALKEQIKALEIDNTDLTEQLAFSEPSIDKRFELLKAVAPKINLNFANTEARRVLTAVDEILSVMDGKK